MAQFAIFGRIGWSIEEAAMLDAERDRERLIRFFAGEFGDFLGLYGNITMEGMVAKRNDIQAVFGMYAYTPHVRFYGLAPTGVSGQWFLKRIPGYGFTDAHAQILDEQLALLQEEHPDWQDAGVADWLWQEEQRRFALLGLPISFFSYQRGSDGNRSVAFWYPRLIPARQMLIVFKQVMLA